MQRILFVDDELKILEGIGRMMRSHRHEWAVDFAQGGTEALSKLAQEPFDVIVTDMRMPNMDGAELLHRVREQYPRTVRIVLTGQCDKDAFFRSVRVAHRHLNKPCDAVALRETVAQACQLRQVLANPRLLEIVSRLETVPSQPTICLQLVRELELPEPSIARLSRLIAQDIGLTAKVLHLANSALFGSRGHVARPEQAVVLLGLDVLKALALAYLSFAQFDSEKAQVLVPFEAIWKHSWLTSALARRIAEVEKCSVNAVECACVAGMLHDLGSLVLAHAAPDDYRRALDMSKGDFARVDAEREVFGTSHAKVGAHLLGLWGLPDAIVEAVAWHHLPGSGPAKSFSPIVAVHVADYLTGQIVNDDICASQLDEAFLTEVGLIDRLPLWKQLGEELYREGQRR